MVKSDKVANFIADVVVLAVIVAVVAGGDWLFMLAYNATLHQVGE